LVFARVARGADRLPVSLRVCDDRRFVGAAWMDGVAMNSGWPLLSLLTWLPVVGGVVVLLLGERRRELAKLAALVFSLVTLVLCIPLWTGFDSSTAAMQFVELQPWIETLNINYHL